MTAKRGRRIFLAVHAALAICVLLFPIYRNWMDSLPPQLAGCLLHDRFFLYCSMCGGTRAMAALLSFRIIDALGYNAYVVLAVAVALFLDVVAWIRFVRRQSPLFRIHPAFWVVMAVLLVIYTVLRNYLMIVHSIDPTGDLVRFWNAARS